jgi:hypothetical protein
MFQTAAKILKATIGIRSNKEELLLHLPPRVAVESLLTDFRRVEQTSFKKGLDGYITVEDEEGDPTYEIHDTGVFFKGPYSRLQQQASDLRHTLWGNQGFLYRFTLYLLEKKHGIHNLHACSLYQKETDTLFVVTGGAGSGKTVFLLSGLEKGLKLFSTETVHFQIVGNDIVWHMGSVVDNVRYGTLMHDFPRFLPQGNAPPARQSIWQNKIALDLSEFCMQEEIIKNPRAVRILFPRVEKGFQKPVCDPVKNKKTAYKILFDNVTEKVAETILLYDELTVLGLDESDLANDRLEAIKRLTNHQTIKEISMVMSNPNNCWEKVLK